MASEGFDSSYNAITITDDSMIQIQRGYSIKMKEWDVLREMEASGLAPNTLDLGDHLRQKQKDKETRFLQPYADLLYEHIRGSVDMPALRAQMMASEKMEAVLFRYKTVIWDHRTPLEWQGRWRCSSLIQDNKWDTQVSALKEAPRWDAYADEHGYNYIMCPVSVNRILRGTDLLLRLNTLFGSKFGVRLLGQEDIHAATDSEPFFARNMEICVRFYGKACPMRLPKLLATYEKYKTHTAFDLAACQIVRVE